MSFFIPVYFIGAIISALAFLLATWKHRRERGYWQCIAIAFSLWPAVIAAEIAALFARRRRRACR